MRKRKDLKRYKPKKSKLLTAALLVKQKNQNVNVQPRIDPVLGSIDFNTRKN